MDKADEKYYITDDAGNGNEKEWMQEAGLLRRLWLSLKPGTLGKF